ncbi:MAG TPA: hypothetical protein VHB72_03925 [Candidatus Saccharimonadales bacterium]|nr:hypothetical protein [Candidatus Saccharimonadales bacterium]
MPDKIPADNTVQILETAPSDQLISSFLRRLKTIPSLEERTLEQWKALEKSQPNIARFIMACSYQAAPDDAEMRSVVTANMLYLYTLLGEAKLHQELRQTYGGAFSQYFEE